jgi:hypothetical protein
MKWTVVTSKRRFEIKAKRRIDAEKVAWEQVEVGEEILSVNPKFS